MKTLKLIWAWIQSCFASKKESWYMVKMIPVETKLKSIVIRESDTNNNFPFLALFVNEEKKQFKIYSYITRNGSLEKIEMNSELESTKEFNTLKLTAQYLFKSI